MGTAETRVEGKMLEYTGRNYAYPPSGSSIYMSLKFKKYSFGDSTKKATEIGGADTIKLPLPEQLSDTANIQVGKGELGVLGGLATDAFGIFKEGGISGAKDALRAAGAKVGEDARGAIDNLISGNAVEVGVDATSAAKYFARSTISSLFPGAALASDVLGGNAINPHATLDFDGVDLKTYQFSWTLAPKSESESELIRNIVRQINFHIHPEYESVPGGGSFRSLNQALLRFPSLVNVSLNGLAEDHYVRFLYPMMVSNFQVNYSPQGNAILEGGKPAIVQMSMSLSETVIRTRQDYV